MPQPIDLQTELARVTATERIQQIADRASLAAQHRGAVETQEQRVAAETQVQQTQAKSEQVDQDLQRRNPFVGKKRRSKKDEKGESGRKESPEQRRTSPADHSFDVTI